jgi:AraC-like DNA-binding protein
MRVAAAAHQLMSVSILFVRALVEAAIASGVSHDELLEAAQLQRARLDDVDAHLDSDEVDRVQLAALSLIGDPALGLRMGERASATAYDIVGYVVSHATTLREAIESFLKFERILCDAPGATLQEQRDRVLLKCTLFDGSPHCKRLRAELMMTGFFRLVRHICGPDASVRRVYFEHKAPDYRAEYARIFEGAERFEQTFTGIEFDRSMLDREQLHKSVELHAMLTSEAERKLSQVGRAKSYSERLRQQLLASAPTGCPDMANAARTLGMSVRSLRRRLCEEGASYGQLVEEAQACVAKRLLDDSKRSIYEAAFDMGFSDPSAFHRAFKRWTGMTPNQYRAQRSA